MGELRVLARIPALFRRWEALGEAPGAREPVLVVPGYGTSDAWTVVLRRHLERLGWRVTGWGLGRNTGDVGALLPALEARVREFAAFAGPVRVVGWSLGGIFAREVARRTPESIAQVITLGTPLWGGSKHTAFASRLRRSGADLDAIARRAEARNFAPISVPVDVFYSEDDRVVAWRASLDPAVPDAHHHRLHTTHMGLVADPEALEAVAAALWRAAVRPPSRT